MGSPTARQNRFFMTRQIANVLEDLDRQILAGASISLLYGLNGVGKSRLLHQFVTFRLHNQTSLFISFNAEGTCTRNNETFSQLDFEQRVLHGLEDHGVLILDQFEHALGEIQRRILQFWSSMAKKKNLKLIISGNHQLASDLSSLASQYSTSISSVELKPLSDKDRLEYLEAQICISSATRLVFPAHIRKLIKQSNGLFAKLDHLCQQHAGDMDCQQKRSSLNDRLRIPLLAMAMVIMVIILLVIFNNMESRLVADPVTANPAPENVYASTLAGKAGNSAETFEKEEAERLAEPAPASVEVDFSPDENTSSSGLDEQPKVTVEIENPEQSLLQQRLTATEQWLAESNNQGASIQVMTLGKKQDVLDSLNRYLQRIQSAGLDLDDIFIYAAPSHEPRVYGVLYGNYSNRRQAMQHLGALPQMLRADNPIPRTVKGLKQEINKN